MKKKPLIAISLAVLILPLVTFLYANSRAISDNFSITLLNNNIGASSDFSFNLIYAAPHLPNVRSFTYYSNTDTFYERDEYEHTVIGFANTKTLELLLDNNLEEFKYLYGQVNLMTEIDGTSLIVFNGWQLGEIEPGFIRYTIFSVNEAEFNKYTINTSNRFIAYGILYHENVYYLIGHDDNFGDDSGDQFINSLVAYSLYDNEKTTILSTPNLINIRNIKFAESQVLATYGNEANIEHLAIFDITKNDVTHRLNISALANRPFFYSAHIVTSEDMILLFYATDDNDAIEVIKVNSELELIEHTTIDINFNIIKRIFEYQGYVHILTDIGNLATISRYDISSNQVVGSFEFEAINNTNSIFLMDITSFQFSN